MSKMDVLSEVGSDYKVALEELTFNSKPIINSLTMIAGENMQYASEIVNVIEKRIKEATTPAYKLSSIYLLDSILKNIGGPYRTLIMKNIVNIFCELFFLVDSKSKLALHHLFLTWKGYFLAPTLKAIENQIAPVVMQLQRYNERNKRLSSQHIAPVNRQDIHVNPKFVNPTNSRKNALPRDAYYSNENIPSKRFRGPDPQYRVPTYNIRAPGDKSSNVMEHQNLQHRTVPFNQRRQQVSTEHPYYHTSQNFPASSSAGSFIQPQQLYTSVAPHNLKHSFETAPGSHYSQPQQPMVPYSYSPDYPYQQSNHVRTGLEYNSPASSVLSSGSGSLPQDTDTISQARAIIEALGLLPQTQPHPYISETHSQTQPRPLLPETHGSESSVPDYSNNEIPEVIETSGDQTKSSLTPEEAAMITSLYDPASSQCSSCGLRFESQNDLYKHMDWHFSVNMQNKMRSKKTLSRSWYIKEKEWIEHSGKDDYGSEDEEKSSENILTDEENEQKNAVADESQPACAICSEMFEQFFDQDQEEWLYKGTVLNENGLIVHQKCLSTSTSTSSKTTTPSP